MAGENLAATTIGALLARDGGSVKTGPFGTTLKAKEYSKTGVPLISVGEVGYGSLRIHESTPRAPREVVERLPEYVLQAGDIVFGRKGAVDRSAMVKPEQAGWFLGSDGIRLRLPSTCDARFIAYQLQGYEARSWLLQRATGTTMASLNQSTIERLPIALPPLPEQRAIAHILGTLDDKIELIRRMNETLEAMARSLFKSWFVDFDPVRAKAEGRDPGLPKPLADLFPARLVDSELGEIPEGWGVRPLRDLTAYLARGIGPEYIESGGVCVLNQKCIRDRRIDFTKAPRHDQSKKSTDGRLLSRLDVLVNSTGVGTLGRVAQLLCLPEPAIVDSHVTVLRAAQDVDPWFLGIGLTGREVEIEALGEGSTGQTELSRVRLGELVCLVPPSEAQKQFGLAAAQLLERLSKAQQESSTIDALRAVMLPKLISGELRVEDAEKFIGNTI